MSQSTIWSQSLAAFTDHTASDAPTPGGGSVSAVTASMGLSLVLMAVEITLNKTPEAALETYKTALALLNSNIKKYADKDIEVFEAYMQALKMPKSDVAEKALRAAAMKEASVNATRIPLEAAQLMQEAMAITVKACPHIKKEVISDIGAGVYLLEASLKAVLLNVSINIPYIKEEQLKQEFVEKQQALHQSAASLLNQCMTLVNQNLL
jgi:methenyltetrahydrofolate cyclohydrolase